MERPLFISLFINRDTTYVDHGDKNGMIMFLLY